MAKLAEQEDDDEVEADDMPLVEERKAGRVGQLGRIAPT